ncbi:potassium channel family protein [Psychroflexus planctonicus]|uniref:Potassium transporter TrkA n=1 Tax=Psychroflexus planctonicus TaxID=1526575 RepID=A0ABQ1SIQ2_9FLAO|nr:potassium channel protein [Psychroflexus planctonicus]GGE36605.1 potassium transporter TrkA [Psychroflexus planctonicus]
MMLKLFKSKIYIAVGLLLLITVIGTLGIKFFEDVSWIDAIYMTVITISTVGYREIVPLSDQSKVFIICLIAVSVIYTAFVITMITQYIFNEYSLIDLKQKRVKNKVKKLTNHVVLCGYGRNGNQALKKLRQYKKEVVVIEHDKEKWEALQDDDILFIKGDATKDEVLKEANIENASHLISALDEDTQNLFIVLSAKQMNNQLKIICRASTEANYKKMKLAGADNVILPEKVGGDHLASLVVTPDLIDFFDKLSISDGDTHNVRELKFNVLCPDDNEKSINELEKFNKTGCKIIGYKDKGNKFSVNPESDFILKKGSSVIIIGNSKQMQNLRANFELKD